MYIAIKITEKFLEVADVLDPTLLEMPEENLVGNYLVINRRNEVKLIVHADYFNQQFEVLDDVDNVDMLKVRKK